ncbi:uncharacterized protein LOC121389987 [Gigantopelta aegis]|uniref:uncharacterized protein LOC121389987 n=1 Tax=Gigantopelta aegis TaxID=1735272 RepID=UPI001B8893A6|nr:uncharacterized protein LOC121389987 [Gigantopelta aegis]
MKFAVQILCVLVFVCIVQYTRSQSLYQMLRSSRTADRCLGGRICYWALCDWRENPVVDPYHCKFGNTTCICPSGTSCERVDVDRGEEAYYNIYLYRCFPT